MTKKDKNIPAKHGGIVIYMTNSKEARLDVKLEQDKVTLSQKQISGLFKTERSVITNHINIFFQYIELEINSVCAIFARTTADQTYTRQYFTIFVLNEY